MEEEIYWWPFRWVNWAFYCMDAVDPYWKAYLAWVDGLPTIGRGYFTLINLSFEILVMMLFGVGLLLTILCIGIWYLAIFLIEAALMVGIPMYMWGYTGNYLLTGIALIFISLPLLGSMMIAWDDDLRRRMFDRNETD